MQITNYVIQSIRFWSVKTCVKYPLDVSKHIRLMCLYHYPSRLSIMLKQAFYRIMFYLKDKIFPTRFKYKSNSFYMGDNPV